MTQPERLGRLGQRDAPTLKRPEKVSDARCAPPPFIRHHLDKVSKDYLLACAAWHVMQTYSIEGMRQHLQKRSPATRLLMAGHLIRCKAWVWLHCASSQQIRRDLDNLAAGEQAAMRDALNELKPFYKLDQDNLKAGQIL